MRRRSCVRVQYEPKIVTLEMADQQRELKRLQDDAKKKKREEEKKAREANKNATDKNVDNNKSR